MCELSSKLILDWKSLYFVKSADFEVKIWMKFRGEQFSEKVPPPCLKYLPTCAATYTYASIKHNISTWNWATCPQRPSFMSSFKDHCKPPIGKFPNLNNHIFKPSLNIMKITSEFVDTFIARCTVAAAPWRIRNINLFS